MFGKFPGLKVVLMESGVSWLPAFMWRANKTWRACASRCRGSSAQPADDHARPRPRHHAAVRRSAGCRRRRRQLIEQIGSDKMFLFASDYPHWQFDGDDPMPPHLPASIVSRMCADNPLETFPRLKLAA